MTKQKLNPSATKPFELFCSVLLVSTVDKVENAIKFYSRGLAV